MPRKQGGKGLTSIEDIFTSRTVSLATHIENNKDRNPILQKVYEHEQLRLFRVANEFKEYLEVQSQQVGQEIRKALRSNHEKDWTDKVQAQLSQKNCIPRVPREQWSQKPSTGMETKKSNENRRRKYTLQTK